MKIKDIRFPFTKKSCLLVCFFACMFVFASFTRQDKLKVREFKKELIDEWKDEKDISKPENTVEEKASAEDSDVKKKEVSSGIKGSLASNLQDSANENNNISYNTFFSVNSIAYDSAEKQGVIGTFSDQEEDQISDNFFTVNVPAKSGNTAVYLEYDLFGLASHESVPRSLNHNIAIGGSIVVANTVWTHQREKIGAEFIKQGSNTILFTSPAAGVKYKVKNLRLVFEKDKKATGMNISSAASGQTLYVKGSNVLSASVIVNNETVFVKNGEFEKTFEMTGSDQLSGAYTVTAGGAVNVYKIPEKKDAFKVIHSEYPVSRTVEISKDKEYAVSYGDIKATIEKETSSSASVEFSKLREKDFPVVSGGIKNISADQAAYRVSVVAGKLDKKIKITIPYDQKRLGLISPKDIRVFYFDYSKRQWVIEKSAVVDEKSKTVTLETKGDNDYINGIISVPESPQTNAFSPTSMSGLKAGDPTAATQFIAPPTANQKGDANVSYPIVIPSGRKGMQPGLSIAYSSSSGNGWMGEGWDVSGLSSINIDTRWGSPTFDSVNETELYSLNGEMLVYDGSYLPHRHNDIDETSGVYTTNKQKRNELFANNKKVFFLRRNHNFIKIERYGATTKEYRWVITSTDGTKTYYGGDESSVNSQSVVTTPAGDIVQWAIWKVEDTHKNNIIYYYENVNQNGFSGDNANLNNGNVFHIQRIVYTGKDGADGLYSVEFEREASVTRQDISINAKQGVKRIEPYKLNKIYVKYNGQTIRSYQLNYATGEFFKTLLQSIYELDKNGSQASRYDLEYYNDILSNGSNFSADSSVNASVANAFPVLPALLSPSKISANYTFEWGVHGRVPGIGISILWPTQNPFGHAQGSFNLGMSNADAKKAQQLVDFDGDGIQDIIYRKPNSGLFISPGSLDSGSLIFGSPKPISNLQSNFSQTSTKTDNIGYDVGMKVFGIGFNFSQMWSTSKSNTPVYLTDANSDGLMDVVKDGEVWFNKLSGGVNQMTKFSDQTENMVIVADAAVEHASPMEGWHTISKNDVVKMWIAPKDGNIKITDEIEVENVSGAKAVYSIEMLSPSVPGKNSRVYLTELTTGVHQNLVITNYNTFFSQIQMMPPATTNHLGSDNTGRLFVKSGDKVFIRLHKREDKNFRVFTNPKVEYVDSGSGAVLPNNEEEEQSGFYMNNGTYSDNFLLNNNSKPLTFSEDGTVNISVPSVSFPKSTDDIIFKISKLNTVTDAETPLYTSNTYVQSNIPFVIPAVTLNNVNIIADEVLQFTVVTDSHMAFKNSNWNNIDVTFTPQAGGPVKNYKGIAEYPSFHIKEMGKKVNIKDLATSFPAGNVTYGISFNKSIPIGTSGINPGTFYYIIKKGNTVLGKRRIVITVNNGVNVIETDMTNNQTVSGIVPIPVYTGDLQNNTIPVDQRITIQVYYNRKQDYELYKAYLPYNTFKIYYGSNNTVLAGVNHTSLNSTSLNQVGQFYNNWTQFLYNEGADIIQVKEGEDGYNYNPNTPYDNYGRLINIDKFSEVNLPVNLNYSTCNNIPTNTADYQNVVAQCMADQINNSNFYQSSNTVQMQPIKSMDPIKVGNVEKWVGYGPEQYSMADSFKDDETVSDFYNPQTVDPDLPDTVVQGNVDTKMYAINKKHYSKSLTSTLSGSLFVTVSNSKSKLVGMGSIDLQDYMDMNGDGYPDIVYTDKMQVTNSTGGLGGLINSYVNGYLTNTKSYQNSVSAQYSPVSHKTVGAMYRGGILNIPGVTGFSGIIINVPGTATTDVSSPWSTGVTASYDAKDANEAYWMDLNGDGLADRITAADSNMKYFLNTGNGISANAETFANFSTFASHPVGSASIGFDTSSVSSFPVSVGASASASFGSSNTTFEDINGDGLLDVLIIGSNSTRVRYNLGNKFSQEVTLSKNGGGVDFNNESKTYNGSANLGVHFYKNIPIVWLFIPPFIILPLIYFKIGFDVSTNAGISISEVDKTFKDMNGDGFADLVISKADGFTVNYSNIGKTNKLKSATSIYNRMPLNKFMIDYEFKKANYSNPHGKMVMSKVTVINPDVNSGNYLVSTPGKDMQTQFEYGTSKYDRRERDYFGFDTVTTKELDGSNNVYRSSRQTFYNNSYFSNGILRRTEVFGGTSSLLSMKEDTYKFYKFKNNNTLIDITQTSPITDSFDTGGKEGRKMATVLLETSKNWIYENGGSILITTKMAYNNKGQVTGYMYESPSTAYNTKISYHTTLSNNIIDVPKSIDVYNGTSGTILLRHRETQADATTGNIERVTVKLNVGENADTRIKYDAYGNIAQVIYPPNENNQNYVLTYQYDATQNKYIVQVTDSFNVKSSSIYDPWFDVVTQSKDITGNIMTYQYDARGRITSILAPNEAADGLPYTVNYEYFMSPFSAANNTQRYLFGAITRNYDPQHPQNPIETINIADGLGRVVQSKKDIEVDAEERMSISGTTFYDLYGRAVKQYHTTYEGKDPSAISSGTNYNIKFNTGVAGYYTSTVYDVRNRAVQQIDEDNHAIDFEYGMAGSLLKTTVKEMQNSLVQLKSETYKNAEGKTVQNTNYLNAQAQDTFYRYDLLGQLTGVTDPQGIPINYEYDFAGRRTRNIHPDHGATRLEYDKAGNLIRYYTPNLLGDPSISTPFVKYNYSYNRLAAIRYPDLANGSGNPSNIRYMYGAAGSGNGTARVIRKYDSSGDTQFKYGRLGEVIEENRSIYPYNAPAMGFVTQYTYDSWSRIRNIMYPDGENVIYEYNLGGDLKNFYSTDGYEYVKNITYDHYGQRLSIDFGNDTRSEFQYLPTNRRLDSHVLKNNAGNDLLANGYQYDFVGNITDIHNKAPKSPNDMGGMYSHRYSYDQLNRLSRSEGTFGEKDGSPYSVSQSDFGLSLDYNLSGGILNKRQSHYQDGTSNASNTYDHSYQYIKGTHMVETVTNQQNGSSEAFKYDFNGNPVFHNTKTEGGKTMFWDEQDRLKAYYAPEQGVFQYHTYDDKSDRIIKYNLKEKSDLYQNGSLISSGLAVDAYKLYPNAYISVTSDDRYTKHYYAGEQRVASRVMNGTSIFVMGATPYRTQQDKDKEQVNPETDFKSYLKKAGLDSGQVALELAKGPGSQSDVYYLHGDHLGTATYVTNSNAETTQFFLNLPFGETMAEQMTGAYDNPYKFNAKELDMETGLYYYGARYYNPRLSIWYAVDPLAVYNPVMETQFYGDGQHNGGVFYCGNLNPYIYTYQNPIKYIDPNGKQTFFMQTRSFAPFNTFGGGFEGDGDNRKFSTNLSNTYRIAATAKVNLDNKNMTITPHTTHSDWLGTKFSSATSPTNVEGSNAYSGNKQSFYVHMFGKNKALLWGYVSPDIDASVSFNVSKIVKGQSFDIEGQVFGDKFPSNETFITDLNGNSIFLGVSGADGSPFTSLAGDNDRPMSSFKFKVLLNSNDTFKGVNYRGKNYTLNQWNSQFQKLNPQDGSVQSGKAAK